MSIISVNVFENEFKEISTGDIVHHLLLPISIKNILPQSLMLILIVTSCLWPCLLLQFISVFFLSLLLSISSSTPETQVIRGRVGSVSHPVGHRMKTSSQSVWLFPLRSLSLSFLNNLPGRDPSLMIGWTVHRIDPGGTAQHIHWLCSWEGCGCPFPSVSHHVIQSCKKNQHLFCYFKNRTEQNNISHIFYSWYRV